jgi:hypothetical protein
MTDFKVEPHNFNLKVGAYQYCSKCGLVASKNEFTQWAMRMGCDHKEHSGYQAKRQLTNPFM